MLSIWEMIRRRQHVSRDLAVGVSTPVTGAESISSGARDEHRASLLLSRYDATVIKQARLAELKSWLLRSLFQKKEQTT